MSLLSTPVRVRGLELKNRLILPPMAVVKGDEKNFVTDDTCTYYREKGAMGFGLIVTEHWFVSREGQASATQLSAARPEDLEGMKRIADAVHNGDTPVFAQLNHAGAAAFRDVTGLTPMGPSETHCPGLGDQDRMPHVMTKDDILRVTDAFVRAARMAQAAGFDGVEIHAAHAYLLCEFFSPLMNLRTDEYNGSTIEGRTRFALEVIRAVRDTVGGDYPLSLRLGGWDCMEGGSTPEDAAAAAKLYEAAGIDLFDVSGGLCYYRNPLNHEPGYFAEETRAVKAAVSAPVVLAGGITAPSDAERFLADGSADLIGAGRVFIKASSGVADWLR